MRYVFRYIDDGVVLSEPGSTVDLGSDAEAIAAVDDGVRCMISDRMRQHLPMNPLALVEASDENGQVVHRLTVADVLRHALTEGMSTDSASPTSGNATS